MAEANQEDGAVDRGCQRDKIKELIDQPLNKGDAWCLLDLRWFAQWKLYVGWDEFDSSCAGEPTSHPGPVDNSALLQENQIDLKEHLSDVTDYVLVPKAACEMLVDCYGILEGQEIISREVIDQGILSSYLVVEIYLTELRLALFPDVEQVTVKKFSKADSLENVEKLMRTVYAVPANRPVRLWSRSSTQVYEELTDKKQSIQEHSLSGNQTIVMEVQSETGTWPRRTVQYSKRTLPGSSLVPYSSSYADGAGSASSSRLAQPGICGLNNLGNTCFMNSVLQCMSNTPPIVRYFLEDHHWSELNKDNPLGNHGEIAKAFAELLKAMWSGQHQAFAPRAFKLQVGRFAPQFSGYQQHDSQELLTFLLDGLHEDLNRIVKKPYVEMKDADGRSDEKVAQEAWQNYRKRNDSMIVDLFHGLLKSTLVCPECSKVSVTFDPTCYLSLPLPVKKERNIDVYLVPLAGRVKRYRVVVPKLGNISDLTDALTKLCAIPGERLVVCDVHQHRFHRVFSSDNTVSHINDRDVIYVYESADKIGASGTCCLSVYLKEARTKTNYGCGNLFGVPFIMQVPREGLSYDQLYEAILSRLMQRHIKTPIIEAADADDAAAATDMEVDHVGSDSDNGNEMAADDNQQQPQQQRRSSANNRTATKHLFTVEMSNTSGTSNGSLKCDNRSVTLNAKSCVTCEWMPAVKEAYFDADADDDVDEDASFQHRPVAKKHVLQLRECLELFTSVERLGAEDAWYCPVCKEHKRATKKFDLWSLPEVLVIHLKRFSYTRSLRDKLDTLVEFPTHGLDMTPYVINPNHPPAVYDLIGVCNHYGGLGGGHYTAYAKNKDDGRWYCFDDSSVSEAQEDAVCSKAAYVLFYIRRNGSKQWLDNIKPRKLNPSPAPARKCVVKEASNGSEEDEDGQDMDSS